ncbi:MAG: ATP-binding protein [Planctomycetota bacterium]
MAPDSPRIAAVGVPQEEISAVAAGLGLPVEVIEPSGAPAALARRRPDLVLADLGAAAGLIEQTPAGPAGPQFLVLYSPEEVRGAEALARSGRVHLLSRGGDYLAWLPQFARQAAEAGQRLREAVRRLVSEKHRLESAIESMSEGLLVLDRDYRSGLLNPVARELLGVDSLQALAARLRDGDVDPGLHPLFWLEAHGPESQPVRCWVALDCGREDCPAYGCGLFPCWLYDGTLCHGDAPERFPDKLTRCAECEVYRSNAPVAEPSRAEGCREVMTERSPQRVLASVSSPIVDEEGAFLGAVKLLREVTVERKLERMRAQFVEFITHELRTPLTAVSGYLWLLLEEKSGRLTAAQRRQLGVAHRQCKRLMGLVDELLDLSAIETGHLRLTRQRFDLAALLDETVEALRPQAQARQVDLRVATAPRPLPVDADRIRIGQVLTNLAANAVKYTAARSPVTLSARRNDEGVVVEVADAGRGISAADLPHLFDRYYRADVTAARARGTGLGLPICKGIIDAHGGHIWAESVQGRGARFLFTLPPGAPAADPRAGNARGEAGV